MLTPLLSRTQPQTAQPSFVRTNAGYLLSQGYGRQLWQQARRQFRSENPLARTPLIATIAPVDASEAVKLAQALGSWEQIEGIALHLTDGQTPD